MNHAASPRSSRFIGPERKLILINEFITTREKARSMPVSANDIKDREISHLELRITEKLEQFLSPMVSIAKATLAVLLLKLLSGSETYILNLTYHEAGFALGGTLSLTIIHRNLKREMFVYAFLFNIVAVAAILNSEYSTAFIVSVGVVNGFFMTATLRYCRPYLLLTISVWYLLCGLLGFQLAGNQAFAFLITQVPFIFMIPTLLISLLDKFSVNEPGVNVPLNVVFTTIYICGVEAVFVVQLRAAALAESQESLLMIFILQNYVMAFSSMLYTLFIRGNSTNFQSFLWALKANTVYAVVVLCFLLMLLEQDFSWWHLLISVLIANIKVFVIWTGVSILKSRNVGFMFLSSLSSITGIFLLSVFEQISSQLALLIVLLTAFLSNLIWFRITEINND